MNFFEAQARARRKTSWLVLLFALAVLGLIILTNLLVIIFLGFTSGDVETMTVDQARGLFNWEQFTAVGLGVAVLILFASLYKISALSSGGQAVAEMLNGKLIPRNTQDPKQRQLLNVVEEMAIASGSPVPNVYLLNEVGINAFAAGNSPQDAVIGITQGTLDNLNRDELQGVIGHEFSHIFNGDMKLNIQLIGVLNGILIIYMIGYFIFRSTTYSRYSSRRRGNEASAFMMLGLGLMAIGGVGKFFGQWIKAIISREREYLADASAVQFTRNNQGIGNALKKIGGLSSGSVLQAPSAAEYSHAYFAEGISSFWGSLFATHPPLTKRIKRIDPYWDGKYIAPEPEPTEAAPQPETKRKENIMGAVLTGAIVANSGKMVEQAAEQIVARVGSIKQEIIAYAHDLLDHIPEQIKSATEEAFGARAIIYVMLIENNKKDRTNQLAILNNKADPEVAEFAADLREDFSALDRKIHLPLVELSLPSLKQLSADQYRIFRETVESLIAADHKVDLKEWFIQRLVLQQLDEHFGLRKRAKAIHFLLGAVKADAELLLSLLATIEHKEEQQARAAFVTGIKSVGAGALTYMPRSEFSLEKLNQAVDNLAQMKPVLKQKFLQAGAATILHDAKVTERGIELLRAVSSVLDCPMPPVSFVKS